MSRVKRATAISAIAAATLLLSACAQGASGGTAPEGPSLSTVKIGIPAAISNAPLFIAIDRGYFDAEGITLENASFKSAADMIAPLGSGQLDVGTGASSAGVFNAAAQGVHMKIASDKAIVGEGNSAYALVVRKDLIDSGAFTSFADLRGLTVSSYGAGGAVDIYLDKMLEKGGLAFDDINLRTLGGPDAVTALANGAIDAAALAEPQVAQVVAAGTAVRFAGSDVVYPNQQIGVLMFSDRFASSEPETATAFMRAYLKGVRDYSEAIIDGKIGGTKGDEILPILVSHTGIDGATLRNAYMPEMNPKGELLMESLKHDLVYWKAKGLVKGDVEVDDVVDTTFIDKAAADLGRSER
ncbi:ABC transporter substrate-binding protein [Pseudarthrobacter sulfonivorans]|uniref:ABC transporter substrate-binding protein n=1 Tax=Pseudarthrobacter sulfonivorans TaxID=121292 RepID=UPI00168A4494|nr:ABC transporter substrate-binding protein [Pseudarthrobacter sulfonivorans]